MRVFNSALKADLSGLSPQDIESVLRGACEFLLLNYAIHFPLSRSQYFEIAELTITFRQYQYRPCRYRLSV
jgi:hypothetical protein